jgi:uncharacterized protein (DUF3084 family)
MDKCKRHAIIFNKQTLNSLRQVEFMNLDSTDQLSEKVAKLKAYAQSLKGKEIQLKEKERQLKEKELQLKLYRKNILIAIREQLSENNSYEDNVKILRKYRDILQFVSEDIQDDLDEIMG